MKLIFPRKCIDLSNLLLLTYQCIHIHYNLNMSLLDAISNLLFINQQIYILG